MVWVARCGMLTKEKEIRTMCLNERREKKERMEEEKNRVARRNRKRKTSEWKGKGEKVQTKERWMKRKQREKG